VCAGDEWRAQRKLYSNLFSHQILRGVMFVKFEELVQDMLKKIDTCSESGGKMAVHSVSKQRIE